MITKRFKLCRAVAPATSLLVTSPWIGPGHRDFVLRNLSEVVDKILQLQKPQQALVRQPQAA